MPSSSPHSAAAASASLLAACDLRKLDSRLFIGRTLYLVCSCLASSFFASTAVVGKAVALWSRVVMARGAYPLTTYAS